MKSSNRNKIITLFFALLIVGAIGLSLILPDKYYSESERRKLAQKDSLKISEYLSGKFQKNLDKYLNDQFPWRDGWITVKTLSDMALGKREANGVYFGKDGYLIQKFSSYDRERFEANVKAAKKLADEAESLNVSFIFLPVPTAVQILSDKLPAFAPHIDQTELINYMKAQGIDVLDVTKTLGAHKDEYIYYRNDHHYTSLGAYYCYKAYRESRGLPVCALNEYTSEILSDNFKGTSYAKVNYPFAKADIITAYYKNPKHEVNYNDGYYLADSIYERKFLKGKDQYGVFLNSNQAQTVIKGSGKDGKLLIIKDSYGNAFAQFPAEDYAEVHMLDLRFFRGNVSDYIRDNGITEALMLYGIQDFANDVKIKA